MRSLNFSPNFKALRGRFGRVSPPPPPPPSLFRPSVRTGRSVTAKGKRRRAVVTAAQGKKEGEKEVQPSLSGGGGSPPSYLPTALRRSLKNRSRKPQFDRERRPQFRRKLPPGRLNCTLVTPHDEVGGLPLGSISSICLCSLLLPPCSWLLVVSSVIINPQRTVSTSRKEGWMDAHWDWQPRSLSGF